MGKWVKIRYRDDGGYKERKLEGKSVGYHLEDETYWTIWADDITFAIPLSLVCNVEICRVDEDEEEE